MLWYSRLTAAAIGLVGFTFLILLSAVAAVERDPNDIVYSTAYPCSSNAYCHENGQCFNTTQLTCECHSGWTGSTCSHCKGRLFVTGDHGELVTSVTDESYLNLQSCGWVVENKYTYLHLYFQSYELECSWDHLTVYEGDSANDKLIVTLSGSDDGRNRTTYTSTAAFLTVSFKSDYYIAHDGFVIRYESNDCPYYCLNGGTCAGPSCECTSGFGGDDCSIELCDSRKDCSNRGDCGADSRCVCDDGFIGDSCSETFGVSNHWRRLVDVPSLLNKRIASSIVHVDDISYIYGGLQQNDPRFETFFSYNSPNENITRLPADPGNRYHTKLIHFNAILYLIAGQTVNQVLSDFWAFDIATGNWTRLTDLPFATTEHTAHVIDGELFVFLGLNHDVITNDFIQKYSFSTRSWSIKSVPIPGLVTHDSVTDGYGNVFVFGGHRSPSPIRFRHFAFKYNPDADQWFKISVPFTIDRLFMSLAYLPLFDQLVVFAGRTGDIDGKNCYTNESFVFDLRTSCFTPILSPSDAPLERISALRLVIGNETVAVYGGFSNAMSGGTALQLQLSVCYMQMDAKSCLDAKCMWRCERCYPKDVTCRAIDDACELTVQPYSAVTGCRRHHTCTSCLIDPDCSWSVRGDNGDVIGCVDIPRNETTLSNITSVCNTDSSSCALQQNCSACLIGSGTDCLWCSTFSQCVSRDFYIHLYPYGQCQAWTKSAAECSSGGCDHRNCTTCMNDMRCGWCKDDADTGIGECFFGNTSGPILEGESRCDSSSWMFLECPLCDCSGHASCYLNSSTCMPCQHNTAGDYCEYCDKGYFGNALNGGECIPCDCGERGGSCNPYTGECLCDTHGMLGISRCTECETDYTARFADCFYQLKFGYRFNIAINGTKSEIEKEVVRSNYVIPPEQYPDSSYKILNFNCTNTTDIYIYYSTEESENPAIGNELVGPLISVLNFTLNSTDHSVFLDEIQPVTMGKNYTVWIFTDNFTTPITCVVVYHQDDKYLFRYMLIMFSVFLFILLIILAAFQVKRHLERRALLQTAKIEMAVMRQRPYAEVFADITQSKKEAFSENPRQRKKATLLSTQQMANKNVLATVLIRLPSGGRNLYSSGNPLIALGTTQLKHQNDALNAKFIKQSEKQL